MSKEQFREMSDELKEKFSPKLDGYKLVRNDTRDRITEGMFVKYNKIGTDKLTTGIVVGNDETVLDLQSTDKSFTWKISFKNNYVFYKKPEHNSGFKKVVVNLIGSEK